MNKISLNPICENNLESKVYEEIFKRKKESGEEQQEVHDRLYKDIASLENKLSIALNIIDRDFVKKEKPCTSSPTAINNLNK